MTGAGRAQLDELLRVPIREAIRAGADGNDIAFLLTRMLPEIIGRREAHGHVEAAFDLAKRDLDAQLPCETGPFDRMDP